MLAPRECALCNAQQRLDNDDKHGSLDAKEDCGYQRDIPEGRVNHGQREHNKRTGQDKQKTHRHSAFKPVHAPTDVSCELHGFRPGQQHAKTQSAQVVLLTQPPLLIDDDAVHERDLRRRTAKAEYSDAFPQVASASPNDGAGTVSSILSETTFPPSDRDSAAVGKSGGREYVKPTHTCSPGSLAGGATLGRKASRGGRTCPAIILLRSRAGGQVAQNRAIAVYNL